MPYLIRPNIQRMRPYPPGKPIEETQRELGLDEVVKLASNENPFGPSPKGIEALQAAASNSHLYPDARGWNLRRKIAERFGADPDSILLGNGSDQILGIVSSLFLEPGTEMVMGDPSFLRYDAAAEASGATLIKVALDADWRHDLPAMASAANSKTRLVFVANPNNPTGTTVTKPEFDDFLSWLPENTVVILDEAYFEFAKAEGEALDGHEYVKAGKQVVALRTLSKSYGLAGLRVGYGFANPEVVKAFDALRPPFDVNLLALAAATAALDDEEHLERTLQNNAREKARFFSQMAQFGLKTVPSKANFVCVNLGRPDLPVCDALLRQGVIVRPGTPLGMPGYARVSLGTPREMDKFYAALETALQKEPLTT